MKYPDFPPLATVCVRALCVCTTTFAVVNTQELSRWQICRQWRHQKMSWQLPGPPMTTKLAPWRLSVFHDYSCVFSGFVVLFCPNQMMCSWTHVIKNVTQDFLTGTEAVVYLPQWQCQWCNPEGHGLNLSAPNDITINNAPIDNNIWKAHAVCMIMACCVL